MKANNSLRINMPRALELISFFFLGHGPTSPISDLSGSAITRENCTLVYAKQILKPDITITRTLSENNQNAKLMNSANLYGNAKTQDQSFLSTGNWFVAHHCTNKKITMQPLSGGEICNSYCRP